MTQKFFIILCFFIGFSVVGQKKSKEFRVKKIEVKSDTLQIDTLSINPQYFKVLSSEGNEISNQNYTIDFSTSQLIINKEKYSNITIEYLKYPNFITKTYSPFNKKRIVSNTNNTQTLYSETTNKNKKLKFFNGLQPKGFIARGITVGNNQNAVTNSSLDLTLEGKLSDKVSIRANIFDTNFPLQQNGYSQNITDFDRIFVELYTKNWRLKGGDVSLQNNNTTFLNFQKQVAGVEAEAKISKKTTVSASGAVVRGRFSSYNFIGKEGNQGPYKILGTNSEPAIIIVRGSDNVYVNGIQLKRGEHEDYVIDYNLAEIRFNTTYPITNDMRIRVEFQYSDRNYTRFVTYEKAAYKSGSFSISGYFYNENDAKNQPIQQALTDVQKQLLANAGDNASQMVAESAYIDEYSPSRIQYKKENDIFEYSNDANDELYSVTFTSVGTNQGNYIVDKTTATGTIYRFAGKNQGNFNPILRLVAPTSLQVAVVNSQYNPSEKTNVIAEIAYSNNDLNLFSTLNDTDNQRMATKVGWQQTLIDSKWNLTSNVNYKFIQEGFQTVQRFQAVEFNRNWNLVNPTGSQHQIGADFILKNKKDDFISYGFHHLNFTKNYSGAQHKIRGKMQVGKTYFSANGSWLTNSSELENDTFFRLQTNVEHDFNKKWVGVKFHTENNDQQNKTTKVFNPLSFRFSEYETYFGIGDTTKIFAKFGVNYRTNDSIRNNTFAQINNRKTFFVASKIIQNERANLSLYGNYQLTNNAFTENQKTLNSKVVYKQRFFDNLLTLGTTYETSSGNIARQDYVYVKTESGQGFYTWVDYNNDDVQDFNEFEIAQFQDQADYLRVALPNIRFLPTQRAMLKQSVTFNPLKWSNQKGFKKILSHWYNQTYLSVDNEQERQDDNFNFNPFNFDKNTLLGLLFNFRNSLYYNRNLQDFSWVYTYGKSRNKQQFNIGIQEGSSFVHQLEFIQKFSKFWLVNLLVSTSENKLETENLTNRNYRIEEREIYPKLTYLYNKDHRFSVFYQFKNKKNQIEAYEKLQQQKMGIAYFYIGKKRNQISADFNVFLNNFSGNSNSPIGYQMLEGLQAGQNYTWNILFNQKLNSLLHLNVSYLGRKSKNSQTIHTGMIQLKAVF